MQRTEHTCTCMDVGTGSSIYVAWTRITVEKFHGLVMRLEPMCLQVALLQCES